MDGVGLHLIYMYPSTGFINSIIQRHACMILFILFNLNNLHKGLT